jgi:hypothetical protein
VPNQFDWDDEEQDFRDIPDEVHEQPTPMPTLPPTRKFSPPPPGPAPAAQSNESEDYYDEAPDDYEDSFPEDFSSVLADARLRLEQGRLYEMIMNHELFEGVDADPKAINNVQNEVRAFAKERMEIMLGMRSERSHSSELGVDLPFNSLEVEVLRSLASTATKGATKSPDVEKYVAPIEPRRSRMNSIGGQRRPAPPQRQAVPREQRPLPSRPQAPVRRPKPTLDPNVEARLRADGVEQEYIEEAKRQLSMGKEKHLGKQIHEMSEQELRERNQEAAQRSGKQVKSTQALPQPSEEQMHAVVMQQVSAVQSSGGLNQKITDMLLKPRR